MENIEKFKDKLKKLRRESKLTQAELATSLKISSKHVTDMEGGRRSPSRKLLEQIAEVFGVTVSSLIDEAAPGPALIQIPASETLRKYLKIPDDIVEKAQGHSLEDKVWELVRDAFIAVENHQNAKKKAQKNHA